METNLLSFEIIDLSEITGITNIFGMDKHDGCGQQNGQCGAGCGCGSSNGNCGVCGDADTSNPTL